MRVATFNIHHGRGMDDVVDLDRTAGVVAGMRADLVALQELDVGWPRSGRTDQPRELSERLGTTVHFWPTIRRHGGWYGLGLAASEPIEGEAYPLPQLEDPEPRVAVLSRWRDLSVICVHLSTRKGPRRAQVGALARLAASVDGPLLVMGDLNATPFTLGSLRRAGLRRGPGWRSTMVRPPWRRIDHIYAGGGLRVARSGTVRSDASDHLALWGDVVAS